MNDPVETEALAPSCADLAARRVAAARDAPERRYGLRAAFYDAHGFRHPGAGYGESELAFLRWEIDRRVLDPAPRGSPWWRAVNESLLRDAEEANLLLERGSAEPASTQGTAKWLEYLRRPSEVSWYRAHNTSVACGYLEHEGLARLETEAEQRFIGLVLSRLLYAQCLAEEHGSEGGLFARLGAELGRLLADPSGEAITLLTRIPAYYPRVYPVTDQELERAFEEHGRLWELILELPEGALIRGHEARIYAQASASLELPGLLGLLRGERPLYPPPA